MAVTATNLIMGPGTLYVATFGTAEPADSTIATAPASYTDVGGTQDGVSLAITQEYAEMEVDQLVDVPGRRLTKRVFTLETNLAEPTLAMLKVALNNGGTITTAAGVSSAYEPDAGDTTVNPSYSALIFDGFAPGGFRRRVIIRKALQTEDVEFAYAKGDQTVLSVAWEAHYVSSSIKPFKIVDALS